MRKLIILICLTSVVYNTRIIYAQYQNFWAFGVNAGLDFNNVDSSGLPTSVFTKNFSAEGTVSVCDEQGRLLFYSDGVCVYDRQHQLMPSAPIHNLKDWLPADFERVGLGSSTRSSAQSSIIIPYPGKPNLYYLFSLTGETAGTPLDAAGRLYYSLIDMSLNGGMGDIVDACNGVYLGDGFSEAISSILGLERIWLIVPRKYTLTNDPQNHSILVFPITYDGFINNPVENIMPSERLEDRDLIYGVIPNNQGTQIAYAGRNMHFQLLDFDKQSGRITKITQLDSVLQTAMAFSPNDKILYTYKQQINLETLEKYTWNKSLIATNTSYSSQIKLGPDKRIYYLIPQWGHVGVILEPNLFGFDSSYLTTIDFIDRTTGQWGVPNVYNTIVPKNSFQQLCIRKGDTLKPQTNLDYFEAKWNDSLYSDFLVPQESGIYYVKYIGYGAVYIDSFEVEMLNTYSVFVTQDSIPCNGTENNLVYVKSNNKVPYTALWTNLDNQSVLTTGDTINNLGIGNYQVTLRQNLCKLEIPVSIYQKKYRPQLELKPACNRQNNGAVVLTILNDDIDEFKITWMTSSFDTIAVDVDTIDTLLAGSYYLHLSSLYCDTFLRFNIEQFNAQVDFKADSFLCYGNDYTIVNNSDVELTGYRWYVNDTFVSNDINLVLKANTTPSVHVKLVGENENCIDSLEKTIPIDTLIHNSFSTSRDSICAGEQILFIASEDASIKTLQWQLGKYQFISNHPESLTHAFEEAGVFPILLKTHFRACPETSFTKYVHVYPNPEVYLGNDSSICYQGKAIALHNLRTPPTNTTSTYQWSTGDTSSLLQVKTPGTYWLKLIAAPIGCTGFGSIEISKDCFVDIPNAFTPNGDGANDYFFPRKWLSNGVEKFHLQIFNRWGQLLYETNQTEGLGWDGKWNGQNQPNGVYIYRIAIIFKNGQSESYNGNVTLIR